MSLIVDLLTITQKLNNYAKDATGSGATGTTYWINTTHYRAIVPVNKRWFVIGGMVNRAVSSTVVVDLRDTGSDTMHRLMTETAAANLLAYPATAFQLGRGYVLDAGEEIYMTFGTAQDANSWVTFVVLEISM